MTPGDLAGINHGSLPGGGGGDTPLPPSQGVSKAMLKTAELEVLAAELEVGSLDVRSSAAEKLFNFAAEDEDCRQRAASLGAVPALVRANSDCIPQYQTLSYSPNLRARVKD